MLPNLIHLSEQDSAQQIFKSQIINLQFLT